MQRRLEGHIRLCIDIRPQVEEPSGDAIREMVKAGVVERRIAIRVLLRDNGLGRVNLVQKGPGHVRKAEFQGHPEGRLPLFVREVEDLGVVGLDKVERPPLNLLAAPFVELMAERGFENNFVLLCVHCDCCDCCDSPFHRALGLQFFPGPRA